MINIIIWVGSGKKEVSACKLAPFPPSGASPVVPMVIRTQVTEGVKLH